MKTNLFIHGFSWQREERLLKVKMTMGQGEPMPQGDHAKIEMQINGNPALNKADKELLKKLMSNPETAKAINQGVEQGLAKAKNVTVNKKESIHSQLQREVDAMRASGVPLEQLADRIQQHNAFQLHPARLHASVINGYVQITPHALKPPPSPEQRAQQEAITKAGWRLWQVENAIQAAEGSFHEQAMDYRNHKIDARNPRNVIPEVAKMRGKSSFNALGGLMKPIEELRIERQKIKREIDDLKSGRVKAPPLQSTQQGTPRQSVSSTIPVSTSVPSLGKTPANSTNAPNGFDSVQSGVEANEARIQTLVDRWKKSKTQEERNGVEGFLMMEGVDVDASDIKKDKITVVPKDERAMLFFGGLIKVVQSLMDRFGNSKTAIKEARFDASILDDPIKMTARDRKKELERNEKQAESLKEEKTKLETDVKDLKEKIEKIDPTDTRKDILEGKLKKAQEELKKVETALAAIAERQKALEKATFDAPPDALATPKETVDLWKASFKDLYGTLDGVEVTEAIDKVIVRWKPELTLKSATKNKDLAEIALKKQKAEGVDSLEEFHVYLPKLEVMDKVAAFHMPFRTERAKEQAKGDKVMEEFLLEKEKFKNNIPVMIEEAMADVEKASGMIAGLVSVLGGGKNIEEKEITAMMQTVRPQMTKFMEAIGDSVELEANGTGKYRIKINSFLAEKGIMDAFGEKMTPRQIAELRASLKKDLQIPGAEEKGGEIVTPFVSPENLKGILPKEALKRLGTTPEKEKKVEEEKPETTRLRTGKEFAEEEDAKKELATALKWYIDGMEKLPSKKETGAKDISEDEIWASLSVTENNKGKLKFSTSNKKLADILSDDMTNTDEILQMKREEARFKGLPLSAVSVRMGALRDLNYTRELLGKANKDLGTDFKVEDTIYEQTFRDVDGKLYVMVKVKEGEKERVLFLEPPDAKKAAVPEAKPEKEAGKKPEAKKILPLKPGSLADMKQRAELARNAEGTQAEKDEVVAELYLQMFARLKPKDPEFDQIKEQALTEAKAFEVSSKGTELHSEALLILGLVLEHRGEFDEAIRYYDQGKNEFRSNDVKEARFEVARIRAKLKRDEAEFSSEKKEPKPEDIVKTMDDPSFNADKESNIDTSVFYKLKIEDKQKALTSMKKYTGKPLEFAEAVEITNQVNTFVDTALPIIDKVDLNDLKSMQKAHDALNEAEGKVDFFIASGVRTRLANEGKTEQVKNYDNIMARSRYLGFFIKDLRLRVRALEKEAK